AGEVSLSPTTGGGAARSTLSSPTPAIAVRRGRGADRRPDHRSDPDEPPRVDPAHPRGLASPAQAGRRARPAALEHGRADGLPGDLPLERDEMGDRGLLRELRARGRSVRDPHLPGGTRDRRHRLLWAVPLRGPGDGLRPASLRLPDRSPPRAAALPNALG